MGRIVNFEHRVGPVRAAITAGVMTLACLVASPGLAQQGGSPSVRKDAEEGSGSEAGSFAAPGVFASMVWFYAPENFDDYNIVNSSEGIAGTLGYRVSEDLAFDLRGEWFGGFDVHGNNYSGTIDDVWAVTVNVRFYPYTGRFQPYFAAGLGVLGVDEDITRSSGESAGDREAGPLFRMGGGLDVYLTEFLALTIDGAYYVPGGSVDQYRFGELAVGMMVKF